jgi:hypothetical protein
MDLKQKVCHDCQVAEDYLQNETAWICFIQAVFCFVGSVKKMKKAICQVTCLFFVISLVFEGYSTANAKSFPLTYAAQSVNALSSDQILAPMSYTVYLPLVLSNNTTVPPQGQDGNTYYVATNGNDANPGTQNQPWMTIQKAANTMIAGDTVYVRGGNYANGISLTHSGTAGAYITYQAYPGETPVLSGNGWFGFSDYYGAGVSYIIVDGFEFNGIGNSAYETGIKFSRSNNLIIRNNKIHDLFQEGINISNSNTGEIANNIVYNIQKYNGIWGYNISNYNIHHNTTYNNYENGISVSQGTTNTIIHDNIAYGNSCGADQRYAGIAIEVGSERNKVYNNLMYNNCHANYVTNSSNNEFYNNTLYGNTGSTGYGILYGDWEGSITENNIFKNNILVITRNGDHAIGNFNSGTAYDPLNNTFDYNNYYYSLGTGKSDLIRLDNNYSFSQWQNIGKEIHGILANPNIISLPNDFHLKSNSPAIDAGVAVSVTDDFDGNPRPMNLGFDIGAYELAVP